MLGFLQAVPGFREVVHPLIKWLAHPLPHSCIYPSAAHSLTDSSGTRPWWPCSGLGDMGQRDGDKVEGSGGRWSGSGI